MKNTLKNMVFSGEQTASDPNVLIYKFKSLNGLNGLNGAYVVWFKTKQNSVVNNFRLPLQGTPSSASAVTLTAGSTVGASAPLNISGNSVNITVTEKPVFILVDKIQ